MTPKQKKIATIILLSLMLTCFFGRHLPDKLGESTVKENYIMTLEVPNNDYIDWEKTVPHIVCLTINVLVVYLCASMLTVILFLPIFKIKSHIEYCGKKMVKAIMLQFRPN